MPNVNKAFDEMKYILENKGTSGRHLTQPEGTLLTDLSKRNYNLYCSLAEKDDPFTALKKSEAAVDSSGTNNAFYALQEEVRKFAQYYVRGSRPSSIAEVDSRATDGRHLNRQDRNRSDAAFGVVFSGGMLMVGVILLIISAFKHSSALMMSGLAFIVFAIILVGLRFVKK